MKHILSIYHPYITLIYIVGVLVFSMLTLHPVLLSLSVVCAGGYSLYLNGGKRFFASLRFITIPALLIVIINPLVNHRGLTVIGKIGTNPVTLEAFFYGLAMAGMLTAVYFWCQCYQVIMTNERLQFLLGKTFPTLALLLSMTLKLIPQTRYKALAIRHAQKASGAYEEDTSLRSKLLSGLRQISTLMSCSMEDSIDTADSMRARGYGLKVKRTHFSHFKWHKHDTAAFIMLCLLLAAGFIYVIVYGGFSYYPRLGHIDFQPAAYIIYTAILSFPLILEGLEVLKWKLVYRKYNR